MMRYILIISFFALSTANADTLTFGPETAKSVIQKTVELRPECVLFDKSLSNEEHQYVTICRGVLRSQLEEQIPQTGETLLKLEGENEESETLLRGGQINGDRVGLVMRMKATIAK